VSSKRKRFIVLSLGDTNLWGYNDHTLPMLLRLVDSSTPDYRVWTHVGVLANYLTSARALRKVEKVIASAEALRDTDPRFLTLGVGLAEGELIAEFDWLGRLKEGRTDLRPLGQPLNDAIESERKPGKYKQILEELRRTLNK
jgi:hypothetical protein